MSEIWTKSSDFRHILTKNVSENQTVWKLNSYRVSEIHTNLYLTHLMYLGCSMWLKILISLGALGLINFFQLWEHLWRRTSYKNKSTKSTDNLETLFRYKSCYVSATVNVWNRDILILDSAKIGHLSVPISDIRLCDLSLKSRQPNCPKSGQTKLDFLNINDLG